MFRAQGADRSDRQNRRIASSLALVGGFVNSAGFVFIGSFTSHTTGNVGRFANDLATSQFHAALAAATMIAAFLAGAFVASMLIESNYFERAATSYGIALLAESALLLSFAILSRLTVAAHPGMNDYEAAILCAAMGVQNSLVTRLSGAVVRTTHLTGVITDVGIEGARWFRWWRSNLSSSLRVKLGRGPAERPSLPKIALLLTIAGSFMLGAIFGAIAAVSLRQAAMLLPCVAVAGLSAYAFRTASWANDRVPPSRETRK